MRVIIDRFEESFAVLELDGKILNVPRQLFPGAKEGDTVEISVLGRIPPEGGESPREIFERLRKKSPKTRGSSRWAAAADNKDFSEPDDTGAADPADAEASNSELTNN